MAQFGQDYSIYEYPYALPFTGALFELDDEKHIAQIGIQKPNNRTTDSLFIEVRDIKQLLYCKEAFNQIISFSIRHQELIVLGKPNNNNFVFTGSTFREKIILPTVLSQNNWTAAIVVYIFNKEAAYGLPVMQFRTPSNALSELNMVSGISGYINQKDCEIQDNRKDYILKESDVVRSARRELSEEILIDGLSSLKLNSFTNGHFLFSNKEHIFFYVLYMQIDGMNFNNREDFRSFTFDELSNIRFFQLIKQCLNILNTTCLSPEQLNINASYLVNNFILHKREDISIRIRNILLRNYPKEELIQELQDESNKSKHDFILNGVSHLIEGLAGFQFRFFFTIILNLFIENNVLGAKDYSSWINSNADAAHALLELEDMYHDFEKIKNCIAL